MSLINRLRNRNTIKLPYTVEVTKTADGMHVSVYPPPVASKPEYLTLVTTTFTRILTDLEDIPNTPKGRKIMEQRVTDSLRKFHAQGIIVPRDEKEKEEGKRSDEE